MSKSELETHARAGLVDLTVRSQRTTGLSIDPSASCRRQRLCVGSDSKRDDVPRLPSGLNWVIEMLNR